MAPPNKTKLKKDISKSKPSKFQSKFGLSKDAKQFKPKPVKDEPKTPKERRLAAKEMSEERKKKRKPNYNLEKELASLWEKMRRVNISKEERSKLISEAFRKMNGKYLEIASSHVSARVLQTCIKYCSKAEKESVFAALQPHLLTLSRKKYAVHLVNKLLDNATEKQLEAFISSLHGKVSSLLRHSVGSAVVDHAYQLAKGPQKQRLLIEMYSTELQLFKDLTLENSGRLVDIISKLGLQRSTVLQYMTSVIQPILEKGILDYGIIHTVLLEYFTIADKSSATDIIQQLIPLLTQESSGIDEGMQLQVYKKRKSKKPRSKIPLLVRIAGSKDGLKLGTLCIKHGSAKERKKIIKGIKDHVRNLAFDQYGSILLTCIISVVDDTKLVSKFVIRELQSGIKDLVLNQYGRLPLLQLLRPQCPRYLGQENMKCLDLSVASLCPQDTPSVDDSTKDDCEMNTKVTVGGKKDPILRRRELLVGSGFAELLINVCIENVSDLLKSRFGKEVLFEVAVGGDSNVLQPVTEKLHELHKAIVSVVALPKEEENEHVFENFHSCRTIRKLILECPSLYYPLINACIENVSDLLKSKFGKELLCEGAVGGDSNVLQPVTEKLHELHKAIASVAALPKEEEDEHVFENFHSSRTIRKLILECPSFATTLWKTALEGKCEMWAQGHSAKVVTAFLESKDLEVKSLSESDLKVLVDKGTLKIPTSEVLKNLT